MKTHSKLALVVRQEPDGLRCYAHIGTGNYHVKTARLYADVGLFTCDPILTTDVSYLFHYLTGHSRKDDFAKLLAAPINMRRRFLDLVVLRMLVRALFGEDLAELRAEIGPYAAHSVAFFLAACRGAEAPGPGLGTPANAELVFFSTGRSMSVKAHRVEGDSLVLVLRGGGEIVCESAIVSRFEPDEVPYPEPESEAPMVPVQPV